MHRPVMAAAYEYQIVERCPTGVGPVPYVVRIAAAVLAAREPAPPVAGRQSPA